MLLFIMMGAFLLRETGRTESGCEQGLVVPRRERREQRTHRVQHLERDGRIGLGFLVRVERIYL